MALYKYSDSNSKNAGFQELKDLRYLMENPYTPNEAMAQYHPLALMEANKDVVMSNLLSVAHAKFSDTTNPLAELLLCLAVMNHLVIVLEESSPIATDNLAGRECIFREEDLMAYIERMLGKNFLLKSILQPYATILEKLLTNTVAEGNSNLNYIHFLANSFLDNYLRLTDVERKGGALWSIFDYKPLEGHEFSYTLTPFARAVNKAQQICGKLMANREEYRPFSSEGFVPPYQDGKLTVPTENTMMEFNVSLMQRIAKRQGTITPLWVGIVLNLTNEELEQVLDNNTTFTNQGRLEGLRIRDYPVQYSAILLDGLLKTDEIAEGRIFPILKKAVQLRKENTMLLLALKACVSSLQWAHDNIPFLSATTARTTILQTQQLWNEQVVQKGFLPYYYNGDLEQDFSTELEKFVFVEDIANYHDIFDFHFHLQKIYLTIEKDAFEKRKALVFYDYFSKGYLPNALPFDINFFEKQGLEKRIESRINGVPNAWLVHNRNLRINNKRSLLDSYF